MQSMASKKLTKADIEWQMFMEYWALFQEYYFPENTDSYWENLVQKANAFAKKYNTEYAKDMALALLKMLEMKQKEV